MSATGMESRIAQLWIALGSTLNYEEGLGNYREARRLADEFLNDFPDNPGWPLCYNGLVYLLEGDLKQATAQFEELEAVTQEGDGLHLLAFSFQQLCRYEQFNTRLDGAGSDATEASVRWDMEQEMQQAFPRLHQLQQNCRDASAQNLSWYLSNILGVAKTSRAVAAKMQQPEGNEGYAQSFQNMLHVFEQYALHAVAGERWADALFCNLLRADILHRSGRHDAARTLITENMNIARQVQDAAREARCHLLLGDWRCAPFSHPLAWDFSLADSSSESSALPPFTEAAEHALLPREEQEEATGHYRQAAQLFREAGAPRGRAQVCLREAYLLRRAGNGNEARQKLQEAETLFHTNGDQRGVQLARTHRLLVDLDAGQFSAVTTAAATIGAWGKETGNFSFTISLGNLLNRFARHLFLRQGRYEAARLTYETARRLFEALGARINATQNLVDLALLLDAVGDFPAAALGIEDGTRQYQQIAEDYPQQYPAGGSVVFLMIQHGLMLAAKGYNVGNSRMDTEQMERFRIRLKALADLLPGAGQSLEDLLQAAMAGLMDGRDAAQMEAFQARSLREFALSLSRQARIMIPFYRYQNAKRSFEEKDGLEDWEEAFQALDGLEENWRHFFEAILWGAREKYPEAVAAHRRHLALHDGTQQPQPSAGVSQDAENLRRQQQRYHLEQAMSLWVKLRQYQEAAEAWRALEDLGGTNWWTTDAAPWKLLCDAAEFNEGLGHFDKAAGYCEQALELLESRRRELSRDELRTALSGDRGVQFLYFLGARLAFRRQDPATALFFAERGRARGLLDLLEAGAEQWKGFTGEQEDLRQWRETNARLSALRGLLGAERRKQEPEAARIVQLQEALETANRQLSALEQNLVQHHPSFFAAVGGEGAILDVASIARQLTPGQLLIEFFFREQDLFCWAVSRQGLVQYVWRQVRQEELGQLATAFHRACGGPGDYQPYAESLAGHLLEPLAAAIAKHQAIYIVPSGPLHLVPFHALPFGGGLLSDSHQVGYLPSASALQYLSDPKLPEAPCLLSIGNPTRDLQAATAEAGAVARLYGQQALLEEEATETAVRNALPPAQLLHLATHGKLLEEAPLASSLLLANGAELSLYEIMGLHLQAELAVLSACDTGRGVATSGDDVLGLTRGILAAGAKGAVVSLWPVDDLSTSLLMVRFHEGLQSGLPPAEALRQAQRLLRKAAPEDLATQFDQLATAAVYAKEKKRVASLRGRRSVRFAADSHTDEGYAHPFFWAPFFYVGKLSPSE